MRSLIKYCQNNPGDKFAKKILEHKNIFYGIYKACRYRLSQHGSYFYHPNQKDYRFDISRLDRARLLYNCSKKSKHILEVGTNMGHSVFIMLLANPRLKITTIDITGQFARLAIKYLQSKFTKSQLTFLQGDSLSVLRTINDKNYDLFHIDGMHGDFYNSQEFLIIKKFVKKNTIKVIFDDLNYALKFKKNLNILNIREYINITSAATPELSPGVTTYYKISYNKISMSIFYLITFIQNFKYKFYFFLKKFLPWKILKPIKEIIKNL